MTKTARQLLGSAGEAHARRYLEAKGFRCLASNWRGGGGELDLVMADHDELAFVEVKTRRGERLGRAEESLTPRQQNQLLITAETFLAQHPDYEQAIWRVDLVALTLDASGAVVRLNHVENCVGW